MQLGDKVKIKDIATSEGTILRLYYQYWNTPLERKIAEVRFDKKVPGRSLFWSVELNLLEKR